MSRCEASSSRGMKRTWEYAAVRRDEDNKADGGFPAASYSFRVRAATGQISTQRKPF